MKRLIFNIYNLLTKFSCYSFRINNKSEWRKINYVIILLFTLFFGVSCRSQKIYLKNPLPNNPTSYTFKISTNDVLNVLQKCHYDSYYSGQKLKIVELYHNYNNRFKSLWPDEVKTILSNNENKYDFWIKILVDSSDIYFIKQKPLEYTLECIGHINKVDSNSIKLEIKVLNAKVLIRNELLPRPPHFVHNPIYKKVEPTTIEEYKILQCIGKSLGIISQMPALKL